MPTFVLFSATAEQRGLEVVGIIGGYSGMIAGHYEVLDRFRTMNILDRGGTVLKTSRCPEFHHADGRKAAVEQLRSHGIDGVVACGGDGTFHGAALLHEEHGIAIVGTPGTIDNDLAGTDFTIGYDTAINTAAQAIDKIRDTADSHGRLFFCGSYGTSCRVYCYGRWRGLWCRIYCRTRNGNRCRSIIPTRGCTGIRQQKPL